MKNIALLLIWPIVFAACNNGTKSSTGETLQKFSQVDFDQKDLADYYVLTKYTLLERIYNKVADSSLTVYKNEGLTEKIAAADFGFIGAAIDTVQVPNPESPDDIFDLIDTIVRSPISPSRIVGYSITTDKKLFTLYITSEHTAYFNWDDIVKAITTEHRAMIKLLLAMGKSRINSTDFETIAQSQFNGLAMKWYNAAKDKTMAAYTDHTLTQTYTDKEIAARGEITDYSRMPNPNNPDDVTDIIEKKNVTAFNPNRIKKLRVCHKWVTEEAKSTTLSTYAYAPLFMPIIGEIELRNTPLFFFSADAVAEKMSEEEKAFYYHFSMALLRNQGTTKTYDNERFHATEYWD